MSPDLIEVRACLEEARNAETVYELGHYLDQAISALDTEPPAYHPERDALLGEAAKMLAEARRFVMIVDEVVAVESETGARKFVRKLDALVARLRATQAEPQT